MWLLKRLKEPSTWAGISGAAAVFGLPVLYVPVLVKIGAAIAATLAVLLPEQTTEG